ncbi:hypothetical protein [Mesorhizobium sp. M0847]|uniref:hypothetical protein n=1 Tax=unclassified Mesorhizobium TaxID=325217 RepID=UPI00333C0878
MDDDELRKLVDEAQAAILTVQSTFEVADVVRWLDEHAGIALDDKARIARLLNEHPRLISAAVGGGMWERGSNVGPPKRRPIGKAR